MNVIDDMHVVSKLRGKRLKAFTSRLTNYPNKHYCWEWQGPKVMHGYGSTALGQVRQILVHQLAYYQWSGDCLLVGHHIHHTCKNKACCNPRHLKQISPHEHSGIHKMVTV